MGNKFREVDMNSFKKTVFVVMVLVIVLPVFIFGVGGCGKGDPSGGEEGLILLCGSSFGSPMERLCSEFTAETGIEVATTLSGSEDFLPIVKAGQEGDILVTHDPFLDYVTEAGVLSDSVHVGFVAPVLAVQEGNPKGLSGIDDLTREGLEVALSDPKFSTCGEMVAALIEKKGIKDAVMKNVGNRLTKGHSHLGNLLKLREVDAVVMWNGVAYTYRDSLDVVKTPYEYDEEIRVHIIGLNYTSQPEALKRFIEFARGRGPETFVEYGYVK